MRAKLLAAMSSVKCLPAALMPLSANEGKANLQNTAPV